MGQYVGARYVPDITGNAYDPTQAYENLVVVDNGMGTSYISRKPVPPGIPLSNTEYWALYGAANGAIINLQNQIDKIKEGFVTPEMFGAAGDGVTDDTHAINDAIAACPNVVFLNKTYMVDADTGIRPLDGTSLFLSEDTILKAISPVSDLSHVIYLYDVENVSISGGTIDGNRGSTSNYSQFGHCILLETAKNVTIENMKLINAKGDGIAINSKYLGDDDWSVVLPSENVKIENCYINNCGRNGISPVAVEGLIIRDCEISDIVGNNPQAGIDIEVNNDSYPVKDFILENLYIHDCTNYELIIPRAAVNGRVTNCTFDGSVRIERGENVTLNDSYISNTLEIHSRDGNDKYVTNCNIGSIVMYAQMPYNLFIDDCIFDGSRVIGQPTINATGGADQTGNLKVKFNGCTFIDNGTTELFSIVRKAEEFKLIGCIIKNLHSKPSLFANNLFVMDGCEIVGGRCAFNLYSPTAIIKNNYFDISNNIGSYGFIISLEGVTSDIHCDYNIVKGTATETYFIRANYGEATAGCVAFNEIRQYSDTYVMQTDGSNSIKTAYNLLSTT